MSVIVLPYSGTSGTVQNNERGIPGFPNAVIIRGKDAVDVVIIRSRAKAVPISLCYVSG